MQPPSPWACNRAWAHSPKRRLRSLLFALRSLTTPSSCQISELSQGTGRAAAIHRPGALAARVSKWRWIGKEKESAAARRPPFPPNSVGRQRCKFQLRWGVGKRRATTGRPAETRRGVRALLTVFGRDRSTGGHRSINCGGCAVEDAIVSNDRRRQFDRPDRRGFTITYESLCPQEGSLLLHSQSARTRPVGLSASSASELAARSQQPAFRQHVCHVRGPVDAPPSMYLSLKNDDAKLERTGRIGRFGASSGRRASSDADRQADAVGTRPVDRSVRRPL